MYLVIELTWYIVSTHWCNICVLVEKRTGGIRLDTIILLGSEMKYKWRFVWNLSVVWDIHHSVSIIIR